VLAQHLADQVPVAFQDVEITRWRGIGARIMGRDHAEQAASPLDERRRLDRPEGGRGRDVPVRREARIGADIGDDDLGALPGRSPARRPVVIDHGEVVEELSAETVLGGDEILLCTALSTRGVKAGPCPGPAVASDAICFGQSRVPAELTREARVTDRIDAERLAEAWSTAMNLRERIAATAVSIAETEDGVPPSTVRPPRKARR
jgi:hypothetical protein